jgi:hypothetical protein
VGHSFEKERFDKMCGEDGCIDRNQLEACASESAPVLIEDPTESNSDGKPRRKSMMERQEEWIKAKADKQARLQREAEERETAHLTLKPKTNARKRSITMSKIDRDKLQESQSTRTIETVSPPPKEGKASKTSAPPVSPNTPKRKLSAVRRRSSLRQAGEQVIDANKKSKRRNSINNKSRRKSVEGKGNSALEAQLAALHAMRDGLEKKAKGREDKKEADGASLIQSLIRRRKAKRQVDALKVTREEESACTIQAIIRGRTGRRQSDGMKEATYRTPVLIVEGGYSGKSGELVGRVSDFVADTKYEVVLSTNGKTVLVKGKFLRDPDSHRRSLQEAEENAASEKEEVLRKAEEEEAERTKTEFLANMTEDQKWVLQQEEKLAMKELMKKKGLGQDQNWDQWRSSGKVKPRD